MADEWYPLPQGGRFVSHVLYSHAESHGPLALAVTAGVSFCAVTAMLVAIAISGFKTQHRFVRSQVGAYFLSLVLSDLLSATGSIMNAKWVVIQGVGTGPFCTTQAALKQTGNIGTALWSLVIAIHTFSLLFLRLRIGDIVFYCILVGVWALIGFVVMMGPVLLQKDSLGPFWGISGYWCWITDAYHIEQFTDEYLFMFITAVVSFVLYSLIFFRLRGNLQGFGWDLRFRRVKEPWVENDSDESQMSAVGKQMLWYPVAYTIIILPIAACRWSAIFGHKVPYGATMAADSIFMLSGFVNAILYYNTRKIVSIHALLPISRLIHIVSPRGRRAQHSMSSKASLDDMQFAPPVTSLTKGSVPTGPITNPVPPDLWQPRRAGEYPDYIRADFANLKSQPWPHNSECASEPSFAEHMSETHAAMSKDWPMPAAKHNSPSIDATRPAISSDPHEQPQSSLPRTDAGEVDVADILGSSPTSVSPHELSESSLGTDGAPSLHRKRFSGWSFPSVPDAPSPGNEDSVHTELEEMRFASPSPERVLRKPSPRPASTGDLPVAHWPPRSNPLE